MFNQVDYIYKIGSNSINEDAYILNRDEGLFAVIDGATGLGGLPGSFAANTIKDTITDSTLSTSLLERTTLANEILGKKTLEVTKAESMDEIPKEKRSSCGIAAIKINKATLQAEFVHSGDCMLFFQLENGEIRILTYDHLSPLDSMSIAKFHDLLTDSSKKAEVDKKTFEQCRENIHELLVENRRKLNTNQGYGVLDGSQEAGDHIEYGRVSLKRVKNILLLSDGLQLPTTKATGQQAWLETAALAFQIGLDTLFKHIQNVEVGDPYCLKYPRLKPSDDKTGIMIHLNP